ncbi:glycosyltransferase family 2 protein [Ciceribacter ferrooxidans]|uniref:Glycosyltransferase family 2 protein n=1 Tax=Ciceribacter ferrooxidans TaxID=2509717 RepID=A0A4Q2TA62_9HYPH|nr:glycosyltransferase family A protein [Ciceribacter ferrooxidans]RYC13958.1 glycosyltransferase family 2 protein [Ciceribacter ferrooxidans]
MRRNKSLTVLSWGQVDPKRGVSVAISLYNYAQFIRECLDSVAAQDWTDIELIVVDDASQRDESLEVATRWMNQHQSRFAAGLLLRHESNNGLAETRNTAFQAAACETVFVMDADNVIYPSCIRKLKRAMDAADADAAYSQLVMFGDIADIGYADYWSKALLATGPYVDAMALVNKRVWERTGGYSHLEGGWEDYDFWCKLLEERATVCFLPELLCKYRVHGSSMLRTESAQNYERLFNTIAMRHPWVQLT